MVFSNKFVICILVNGQPQKELKNGTVSLPFGTEYAIRLRNKNDRKACADIYIDDECVSGGGYVINARDFVDIKRHHDKDRAFKFVSLDSPEAVDAGKNDNNADKSKGVIEIRFRLEKQREKIREVHIPYPVPNPYPVPTPDPWPIWPRPRPWFEKQVWLDDKDDSKFAYGASDSTPHYGSGSAISYSCSTGQTRGLSSSPIVPQSFGLNDSYSPPPDVPLQDGCTVEGDITGQRFTSVFFDAEEAITVLKIFLQGWEDEKLVQKIKTSRKSKKDQEVEDLKRQIRELQDKVEQM